MMQREYWQKKWQINDIGFHKADVHPLLAQHFDVLKLKKGSRVFLPLCGKTRDIAWLLEQGIQVLGAELVEMAIVQLFEELEIKPEIEIFDRHKRYSANNIDILVGDMFNLQQHQLGDVEAAYDRAAFVALPDMMRKKYVDKIVELTQEADQLLITFEYDKTKLSGPPFSFSPEEVKAHYEKFYKVRQLSTSKVAGGLKGFSADEHVWLLESDA